MVDKMDDLVLLLLRCDGKQAAVRTYQEETGASHARAVWAVDQVARKYGLLAPPRRTWQVVILIGSAILAAFSLITWIFGW